MTQAQAVAILNAVKDDPLGPLYRLLLGSGMRLGEAIGLDWGDLHLDDKYVVVRHSKTRVRAVPITDDAVVALRSLAPRREHDPVFRGERLGRRLNGSTAGHRFGQLLAANGLPHMRVHDLRHGVATLMLSSGVQMRVISEQLGHANPALTARLYAHVVPEVQREALDRAMAGLTAGDLSGSTAREDPEQPAPVSEPARAEAA